MTGLDALEGSRWQGTKQLWLDPEAPAVSSEATVDVSEGAVRYTWRYKDDAHEGTIVFAGDGAVLWTDSWHSPSAMRSEPTGGSPALLCVLGEYAAPPGPAWLWRTILSLRPSGELVLQMSNVTPWGEEARAVQIVAQRVNAEP